MKAKLKRGFVAARMRLRAREFLDEIGRLLFDKLWKSSYIEHLYKETKAHAPFEGFPESGDVIDNFIRAMDHKIGIAEIELTDRMISQLFHSDELPADGTWPDEPEYLWPEPTPGFYSVRTEYWSNGYDVDDIDWEKSKITIPSKYIEFKVRGAQHQPPAPEKLITAVLYVSDPDRLLSRVCQNPPLPTQSMVKRYIQVQRSIRLELIAVAWRYLAIKGDSQGNPHRGLKADLVGELQDYIRDHLAQPNGQPFGTAESTMKSVVSEIVEQWRQRNTQASVLVSSGKKRATQP